MPQRDTVAGDAKVKSSGWMAGWMGGWMDGWVGWWMGGWVAILTLYWNSVLAKMDGTMGIYDGI